MIKPLWDEIAARLSGKLRVRRRFEAAHPISGGDTASAYRLIVSGESYFVKLGHAGDQMMFAAEAEGLAAIGATHAIRCPKPLLHGIAQEHAFLVLEHIPLSPHGDESTLGEALAQLHRCTGTYYGWHRDNTLGRTPQDNRVDHDWIRFWRERRLEPQLRMAEGHAAPTALIVAGECLLARLPALLDGHSPAPSLLHGDLWCGNCAYDSEGQPVLYDPAPYYGDRETDLAMTTLFGGFGATFRAAYHAAWPLPSGYEHRQALYNLYHVLNHFNLFGGGYAWQAIQMIERLVSDVD